MEESKVEQKKVRDFGVFGSEINGARVRRRDEQVEEFDKKRNRGSFECITRKNRRLQSLSSDKALDGEPTIPEPAFISTRFSTCEEEGKKKRGKVEGESSGSGAAPGRRGRSGRKREY
ncbi:hypothetical protein F2Q69_00025069 [Brassica cretica]|uniref:Uncharacterized protein n=1 Tax=Brassica cretica TaxID=69181 RepID=A0A8S9QK12_BRACR|nr:hypothetical protein F2Q69_00025069 [Brassica cretica]